MFDRKLKILAIAGSVRKGSFNRALLETTKTIDPSRYEVEIYDGLARLPIFSQDLERENIPLQATELDSIVRNADAVLIATPEYNGSIPGGLKNLLDWGSRPYAHGAFKGMPTAVIGASPGRYGAARSVEMTTNILSAIGAVVLNRKLTVGGVVDRLGSDGQLTDETLKLSLGGILAGLGDLVRNSVAA